MSKFRRGIFDKMDLEGKVTTKAGLIDDSPLPKWLKYNEDTHTFEGVAMPSDVGEYKIKVYITDEKGNLGYLIFKIQIESVYVPSIRVKGLTPAAGNGAQALRRSAVFRRIY